MKKFLTKKWLAAFAVASVVAGLSIGAFAYFTDTGSGTGSATVGTSATASITGTSSDALYPGGPGVDVTITVTNNGHGNQYVNKVHLDGVDAFTDPGFTTPIPVGVGDPTKCDTSKFSMPDVNVATDLNPNGSAGDNVVKHGTLTMANDASNTQDGCKNAYLRLNLSSN